MSFPPAFSFLFCFWNTMGFHYKHKTLHSGFSDKQTKNTCVQYNNFLKMPKTQAEVVLKEEWSSQG